MTDSVVIVHPEWGIFLGVGMGLAFWTELDCVGQEQAPTMTTDEAQLFINAWQGIPNEMKTQFIFHPVTAATGLHATIEELDAAGLDKWTTPLKAARMGDAQGTVQ